MDEWDEFLAKADQPDQRNECGKEVMMTDAPEIQHQTPADLQEFQDNAEILMQVAGGESLNTLLSPNGLWIKSSGPVAPVRPSNIGSHAAKKRSLNNNASPSVPVANSLQDLFRAVVGHPTLSHPLSQMKQKNDVKPVQPFYELDSIGIFFYGTVSDIKIESNVNDDMMKAIPLKKKLVNSSLLHSVSNYDSTISDLDQSFKFLISHENIKILADSLPPSGKSAWSIPFSVKEGRVDLSGKASKSDQLALLYDYLTLSVQSKIEDLLEPSIHLISFNSEDIQIAVKTVSPALSISLGFRGAFHAEPAAQATNFLFSRQSNYSIEVDFDEGPLRCTAIKSFVPKFDTQNRLFLLLKALVTKLSALPDGNYFLAHPANTPTIKILGSAPIKSDQQAVNFDLFIK